MGTGEGNSVILAAGTYRMHCPEFMTDNFSGGQQSCKVDDAPLEVPYHISEMVVTSGEQERKVLEVEHGRIHSTSFQIQTICLDQEDR